jgi:hypothetical protein
MRGSRHELAALDTTKPPLAVHRFHHDRAGQLRGKGNGPGRAIGVDNVLAAAPAIPDVMFRPLPVRAAIYDQVAQQGTCLTIRSTPTQIRCTAERIPGFDAIIENPCVGGSIPPRATKNK